MKPLTKSNLSIPKNKEQADDDFLQRLSAPARRAFIHHGITTLEKVAEYPEKEILKLHGVGPKTIPVLRLALDERGINFKIHNNQK